MRVSVETVPLFILMFENKLKEDFHVLYVDSVALNSIYVILFRSPRRQQSLFFLYLSIWQKKFYVSKCLPIWKKFLLAADILPWQLRKKKTNVSGHKCTHTMHRLKNITVPFSNGSGSVAVCKYCIWCTHYLPPPYTRAGLPQRNRGASGRTV